MTFCQGCGFGIPDQMVLDHPCVALAVTHGWLSHHNACGCDEQPDEAKAPTWINAEPGKLAADIADFDEAVALRRFHGMD